jgi:hypothetical protein
MASLILMHIDKAGLIMPSFRVGMEVAAMGESASGGIASGTYYLLTSDTAPFSLQPHNSTNCPLQIS